MIVPILFFVLSTFFVITGFFNFLVGNPSTIRGLTKRSSAPQLINASGLADFMLIRVIGSEICLFDSDRTVTARMYFESILSFFWEVPTAW